VEGRKKVYVLHFVGADPARFVEVLERIEELGGSLIAVLGLPLGNGGSPVSM
jgi:hypothetical protein